MSVKEISLELINNARGPGAGEFALEMPRRLSLLFSLLRSPSAVIGMVILVAILIVACAASWISPGDPLDMAAPPLLRPFQDLAFPFGSDNMGRDVLSGVVHGASISLSVGVAATALSVTFGVFLGAVAGYFGGRIDDLIVRFIELFQTIPGFVLLVVLVAVTQPTVTTIIFGIALVSWDGIARLARAEFRAMREADFVTAARASGYGDAHIILVEILPNTLPSLIVTASLMVASAILSESALSFLGLGDPNVVSWGSMIGDARELIRTNGYLIAIPGSFIILTVLALNLIGEGLTDVLNPKARHG